MARILIVDERSVYRTGLRILIETNIPHAKVLEATSPLNASAQIRTEEFIDLILIDMDESRFQSIEPLRQAYDASVATRWVIISAQETRTNILASLAAGFYGFISKHQPDNEILGAIRDVLSGRIYVPMSLADTRDLYPGNDAQAMVPVDEKIFKLTARQREVLSLIAHGLSNKEIGRALHITEATTKIHAAALMRILGVRNRTAAAFKAATLIEIVNKLELRANLYPMGAQFDASQKLRLTNGS
ncbi:MAG: response regulator transcription factor [Rhodoplanes sp.]|jgi:DNA-binding NarL/FixJ family response regulator